MKTCWYVEFSGGIDLNIIMKFDHIKTYDHDIDTRADEPGAKTKPVDGIHIIEYA
jgi:hypothetical protein